MSMRKTTKASLPQSLKKGATALKDAFCASRKTVGVPNTNPAYDGGKVKTDAVTFIKQEKVSYEIRRADSPQDYESILFVLKAVSKDETRYFLNVLHVEQMRTGCRVIASDGRRLHYAEIGMKMKSGDYKPLVVNKERICLGMPLTDVNFPNWMRVVPSLDSKIKKGYIDLANAGLGKNQKQTENMSLAFTSLVRQAGAPVNLRYLEDLPKAEFSIYTEGGPSKAILLTAEHAPKKTYAVLMPIAA